MEPDDRNFKKEVSAWEWKISVHGQLWSQGEAAAPPLTAKSNRRAGDKMSSPHLGSMAQSGPGLKAPTQGIFKN